MRGVCNSNNASYKRGCRCGACREAHRVYHASLRAVALNDASLPRCPQSALGYRNGCRCSACKEAERDRRSATPSDYFGTHFTSARDYAEAKRIAQQLRAKGLRNRAARVLLNLDGRWPAPGGALCRR